MVNMPSRPKFSKEWHTDQFGFRDWCICRDLCSAVCRCICMVCRVSQIVPHGKQMNISIRWSVLIWSARLIRVLKFRPHEQLFVIVLERWCTVTWSSLFRSGSSSWNMSHKSQCQPFDKTNIKYRYGMFVKYLHKWKPLYAEMK